MAKSGLKYCHEHFDFIDKNGNTLKFSEYINGANKNAETFQSFKIVGSKVQTDGSELPGGGAPLCIDYKGSNLSGDELKRQLHQWADYGSIEPDVAENLIDSASGGNIDLSGRHFVLIGAGSAIGPFNTLIEHGATVICIDMPGLLYSLFSKTKIFLKLFITS